MCLLKRLACCLAVLAAGPVLAFGVLPRASGSPLQLTVQPSHPGYRAGEPISIGFILQNIGSSPLLLFHPESIHEAWMGWEISCTVTCPDGRKVRLEPEITAASGRIPQKKHFRELMIGGMIVTTLTGDGSAVRDAGGRWVGYLRIPKERRAWPEKGLRRKYRIAGAYGFRTNGEESFIILQEPGKDVFNQPGSYLLECRYVNPHSQIYDERQNLLPVSAWTGTLSATGSLQILPGE